MEVTAKIGNPTEYADRGTLILSDVQKELKTVQDNNIWDDVEVTEEPPEEIPVIVINGITVFTAGNHSLIVGKKKSRKTLFIIWLISLCPKAFLFDTEQGKTHVWRAKEKIRRLTGKDIPTFYLRGKSPDERKDIIRQTLQGWPIKPRVIVIDGIRDLLSNINDADQATDLIVWLEKLTIDFGVHVINVLHLNKTDNNPRGHLGTELMNKAQTTIELELDEKAGVTIVKCESSRDKPFESFAFTHSADDMPEIVNMPTKGNVLSECEEKNRLKFVFDDGILKHAQLVQNIQNHFECGRDKANKLLARFIRNTWIIKNGKDRSPEAFYKVGI